MSSTIPFILVPIAFIFAGYWTIRHRKNMEDIISKSTSTSEKKMYKFLRYSDKQRANATVFVAYFTILFGVIFLFLVLYGLVVEN